MKVTLDYTYVFWFYGFLAVCGILSTLITQYRKRKKK